MSILQSVATLLGRHAQSKAAPPSVVQRPPQPGSTEAHVSKLDEIFGEVVSSLRTPVSARFDAAAASIAQLADSIDCEQDTYVATAALLSFRNDPGAPLSPDPTTAGQSDNSDTVSNDSGRKNGRPLQRPREQALQRPRDRKELATLGPSPLRLPTDHASKTRQIANNLTAGGPLFMVPSQISAAHTNLRQPSQLASDSSAVTRKKRYRAPVPSTHCHICCRPSRSVPVVVCANIAEGVCRKSICNLCIREYNLGDWEQARRPDSGWVCCHCQNGCASVSRAQCFVYKRTNMKRKQASADRKRQKALSSEGHFPNKGQGASLD